MKKYCIALILLLFGSSIAHSQECSIEACVDFPANSSDIITRTIVAEPELIVDHTQNKSSLNIEETDQAKKPFYMAFKTNLLYGLAAVPNIGAEFYLGGVVSMAGNWHYAWWDNDKKHDYWRTYGGDVALRFWMGRRAKNKPLTGHHIGPYGQMITYDFEDGGEGILADRWSWSAGIEYGYSAPIGRRFNIDFTIGLGYHWGEYKEYLPIDGHYVWQATKNRHWYGPTKAEISLVWLIGRGNYNVKKGGRK